MLVASGNVLRAGTERDSATAILAVPTTLDNCRPTPSRSQQRRRRRFQFFTSTSRKQTASSATQRPTAVVPLEESALSSDVGVFLFLLMRVCLIVWLHSSADRRAQANRLCCLMLCLSDGLSLCTFCQSEEWAWLIMCDANKLEFVLTAMITSLAYLRTSCAIREAGHAGTVFGVSVCLRICVCPRKK